jgi:hypothetical protein
LRNCNVKPLSAVNLAVEGQDRAVGIHRDVGRQLIGRERRFCPGNERVPAMGKIDRDRRADRDDERTGALEEIAARRR